MEVTFDHKIKEGSNIFSFWFYATDFFSFIPGQYIEIYIPHSDSDERGIKRWFSLSSSPSELPLISITTRLFDHKSSFKNKLSKLNKGDKVKIIGPMGDFVMPKNKDKKLILVAAGIGITPFRSFIKYLSDTKNKRRIDLIYSTSTPNDLIFKDILSAYDFNLKVLLPSKARLTSTTILDLTKPQINDLIYLTGPEKMVEAIGDQLKLTQLRREQIVQDFFHGYD